MIASRTYFIVNSEKEIDLINQGYLLWGKLNKEDFKFCVSELFPQTKWDGDFGRLKTNNAIVEFYTHEEEGSFEIGIMADVKFSDEPTIELIQLCKKNNWRLFDIDFDKYIPLK